MTVVGLARRSRRYLPMGVLLVVLVVLVVLPLGILLFATFTDLPPRPGAAATTYTLGHYREVVSLGALTAFRNTVVIGLGGTALSLLIGTSLAWLAARTDVPFRPLVQVTGLAPLFISALVGAAAWALLASPRRGFINLLLQDLGVPFGVNVYSLGGMIFVFALYYTPYVFILTNSALTLMNPELEEAGAVHGGRFRQVYLHITIRLITPALLAAATLTFVLIMENFSIPQLLGVPAGIRTVPAEIFRLVATTPSRPNLAAATGAVLLVITATLIYLQRKLLSGRDYTTVTGKGLKPYITPLGRWRWVAFGGVALYLTLAVVLPMFALVQTGLRDVQFIPDFLSLLDLSAFSLRHVRDTLELRSFRDGLYNSIVASTGAAITGILLYVVMAYMTHRSRLRGRWVVEYLANWPLAVPSLVVGLGFLWTWILLPVPIYGTLYILMAAYVARFMPQGFRGISSSLQQIHPELEESARVSGATATGATTKVTLPLIRTGVASTAVLIFVLSFRELSTAIFLFTSDTRVLSIVIYESWESGVWPRVATMSVIYSALLLVVTVIARRWFGLRQAGSSGVS
jgi:iron(III) transport system permease protein